MPEYTYQPYPAWRTHPTLPPQLVETAADDEKLRASDPRWVDPAKPKPAAPSKTHAPAPDPEPEPEPEPEHHAPTRVHEKPHAPTHKPAAKATSHTRRSK